MSITGIILAGGKSRRMGGVDKGLMDFLGKPMVAHVLQRLTPQVDEVFINANREPERYAVFGQPVVQDDIADFAGPLAGLPWAATDSVLRARAGPGGPARTRGFRPTTS